MSEYYFHLDHLTVGYDKKPLIKDICIGIEKGEIVTLIGPNGSGKSTILKSITRQLKLVGGNVEFDGKNLHELSFRELSTKMAVVLTERMKPELMTCHDIVATGRYPYTGRLGMLTREDEEKVEKAMRAVHAEELGGRDFNAISDGQRQRVLLARAICQEPEVIILDEPTSFLDIRHKLELLAILRRMAKEKGITVIMSLHEIDLAQKISDKIICVKLFPISAHRRQFSARISSANCTRLTMVRLTRASEASSCHGRREHRASLSSQAAERESRCSGNCRRKMSRLRQAFCIRTISITSSPAFWQWRR